VVHVGGRDKTVSVDRLKPAFIVAEDIVDRADTPLTQVRVVVSQSDPTPVNSEVVPSAVQTDVTHRTRCGRRVRFPDRYQAGFS
jgi:hypothetical protein